MEILLANNFTAIANKITPKNLRSIKIPSLPINFSTFLTDFKTK